MLKIVKLGEFNKRSVSSRDISRKSLRGDTEPRAHQQPTLCVSLSLKNGKLILGYRSQDLDREHCC